MNDSCLYPALGADEILMVTHGSWNRGRRRIRTLLAGLADPSLHRASASDDLSSVVARHSRSMS